MISCENELFKGISKSDFEGSDILLKKIMVENCEIEAVEVYKAICEDIKVAESSFIRSGIDHGTISKCEIYQSTFEECGVGGSKIENCKFIKNEFNFLSMVSVEVVGNCLQDQNMGALFLDNAILGNNNFSGTELTRLIIRDSNLSNNDFSYCKLSGRQIEYTNFENNNIDNSEWSTFPFTECTFKNMDFRKAKFTDVEFIQCTFEDCLYTEEQAVLFGLA